MKVNVKVMKKAFFFLQAVFHICPLNWEEWISVLKISLPVVFLDESLKFLSRNYVESKDKDSEKSSSTEESSHKHHKKEEKKSKKKKKDKKLKRKRKGIILII
jgi:Ca2+ transporting ATPase